MVWDLQSICDITEYVINQIRHYSDFLSLYVWDQCSLLGFGEPACAQNFGDFPIVNNGKSKNELACAQQKR